jgi:16S rRNA (adenine1518-N6/adenine1519-N6)-dimethyltransferase
VPTHKARKRFGQNFLQDALTINKIVQAVSLQHNEHLVEIGPGLGAITAILLPLVAKLDAVELDRDLIPKLTKQFNNKDNFALHEADILKFDISSIIRQPHKIRVVGNLPYNITTPLLFKLLDYKDKITDMHFMVQKEVAERLIAAPGNKNYGRLSVMVQFYYDVALLFTVKPSCFKPAPKVNSAFIRLIPHANLTIIPKDFDLFKEIITKAFNQRRKTINNSLRTMFNKEDFIQLNIDPILRPECLSIQDFIKLSDYMYEKM